MKNTINHIACAIALATLISGCTSAIDSQGYTHDPWEPMNRNIFAFNEGVDKYFMKPVAQSYEFVFPKPVRTGVSNFFGNLADFRSLGNAILQLDGDATAGIAARVINNTFFGLGGIFDVATPMGNPKIDRNFGSTLAHYGVESGPYVVIPFWGPSTVRDGIGLIPDAYMSPTIIFVEDDTLMWSMIGLNAVQTRASLLPLDKQLEGTTTDKYAMIRDSWLQHRWGELGTPVNSMNNNDVDALFAPAGTTTKDTSTVEPSQTQ